MGDFERGIVLKHNSAARIRAKFVQSKRTLEWQNWTRQGLLEEGKCGGEESFVLVLAFLIPEHFDSGVRDHGSHKGWGRRVVIYSWAGEGGHHHVMV